MMEALGGAAAHAQERRADARVGRVRMGLWMLVSLAVVLPLLAVPSLTGNLSFSFYLMVWIILCTSFNLVAGFTGYMPFGYVAFYGVGAYATAVLHKSYGLPMSGALVCAALAGAAVSLLLAPTLRLKGVYFGIVSLALAVIFRLLVSMLPAEVSGGSMGLILARSNDPLATYYVTLAVLVVCLAAAGWLAFSRTGVALRAVRDDPDAAAIVGIDVARTRLKAWVMAATFPAVVGGLEAWYTNAIDPEASFNILVTAKVIVYSMAGGLGTLLGPVLGAGALYGIDHLIWQRFPVLNLMFLGIIIMVMILVFPRGLVGSFAGRFPRLRRYIP